MKLKKMKKKAVIIWTDKSFSGNILSQNQIRFWSPEWILESTLEED